MSRASWYRHGKPAEKPWRVTQEQLAKHLNVSVRTIQRDAAAIRAERVEKVRDYMAKGHSFEQALELANADEAQSQNPDDVAET
jgi:predicted DNA-binding transcriptional regulator YafY